VIWVDVVLWNRLALPAKSCMRVPSGAVIDRIARSAFDGSM
jgi:hypothetical protein